MSNLGLSYYCDENGENIIIDFNDEKQLKFVLFYHDENNLTCVELSFENKLVGVSKTNYALVSIDLCDNELFMAFSDFFYQRDNDIKYDLVSRETLIKDNGYVYSTFHINREKR